MSSSRKGTPMSDGSVGVESVIHTPSAYNPSSIAGEVAEDMTGELVDQLLEMTAQEQGGTSSAAETAEDISSLKGLIQQLQSELSNTKSELEFAKAENSNLQKHNENAQQAISSLQQQVNALVDNSKDQKKEKDSTSSSRKQLELDHAETKAELERVKAKGSANEALENQYQEVVAQNAALQGQLKATKEELDSALRQAEAARALQSQIPEGDQQAALHLANQQVAQFNTQMAHLYAQLTLARTELEQYKSGQVSSTSAGQSQADVDKQNSQIADLVSDIRHLQLDLEYHQQKLDQLIDEKQAMMQAMNAAKQELASAKQQIEEKDQLLRHKDIDLHRMSQEQSSVGPGGMPKEQKLEEQLAATRSEVAAKDSALIVSHYELHKEKLVRDRLEQKNLKLMERLQKLMMVVETQRKENSTLATKLFSHEQMVEDKDRQLKEVTHKAKQLQRVFKAKASKTPRSGDVKQMSGSVPPEMSSISQGGLPAI